MCHVTEYSMILGVFQQPWPGVSPTAILNEEKVLGTRLLWPSYSRSNWNLKMLVFEEGGKTGGHVPGEKTLGARTRTNKKLNPHMSLVSGIKPGPQWWEANALTTVPSLLSLPLCTFVTHEEVPPPQMVRYVRRRFCFPGKVSFLSKTRELFYLLKTFALYKRPC